MITAAALSFNVNPVRNIENSISNVLNYNPSTKEISYASPVKMTINSGLSAVAVGSWQNRASITVPAGKKWQISCSIQTNYSPTYRSEPPPWLSAAIALFDGTTRYFPTWGDPTTTRCYQTCTTSIPRKQSIGGNGGQVAAFTFSDVVDMSGSSATSLQPSFYFLSWDNTNVATMTYSVVLTAIA